MSRPEDRGGMVAESREDVVKLDLVPFFGRNNENRTFIGWDTETELIQDDEPVPRLVCLQFFDPYTENEPVIVNYRDAGEVFVELARRAIASDRTLVAHNLSFDTTVMVRQHPELWPLMWFLYDKGYLEDTLLNDKLDSIAQGCYDGKGKKGQWRHVNGVRVKLGFSLASCLEHRFQGAKAKADDAWRLRYGELREIPLADWPADALEYALQDGVVVHDLRQKQEEDERQGPTRPGAYVYADAPSQARAGFMLQLMRWRGVHTDAKHVPILLETFKQRAAGAEKELLASGLLRPGFYTPRSKEWKPPARDLKLLTQIVTDAYATAGLEPPRTKEAKKVQCDAASIDTIKEFDSRLDAVHVYNRADKLASFASSLSLGFDRPIHTHPNTLVETGRISWGSTDAEGLIDDAKKINLTNLPTEPGIRESYIPPLGYLILAIDYAQLELVCLSQVCFWLFGYSIMGDMINAGTDLHSALGAQFLNMPYDEFHAGRKSLYEKERDAAKRANFGFLGGMGIDKFMFTNRKLGLSRKTVQELKAAWLRTFPELVDYFRVVRNVALTKQMEQLTSGRIRGSIDYCQTANGFFQPLAADGAKEGAYLCQREMWSVPDSPAYGGWLFAFVHDEIVGCLPEETAAAGAEHLRGIMLSTMQKRVPDVKVRGSIALMRSWRKGASACYDAEGKLIPYEDSQDYIDAIKRGDAWEKM